MLPPRCCWCCLVLVLRRLKAIDGAAAVAVVDDATLFGRVAAAVAVALLPVHIVCRGCCRFLVSFRRSTGATWKRGRRLITTCSRHRCAKDASPTSRSYPSLCLGCVVLNKTTDDMHCCLRVYLTSSWSHSRIKRKDTEHLTLR